MKQITVRKEHILQRKGDLNSKIYEIKRGLLRSYTIDSKGKQHTSMFATEDWLMADVALPDHPTQVFIDALEDSEIIIYEKDAAMSLFDKPRMRNCLEVMQNRVIMLMSNTAIERYEHFVDTYPDIAKRVPQRIIASYLGITPEALSKVKRERQKER